MGNVPTIFEELTLEGSARDASFIAGLVDRSRVMIVWIRAFVRGLPLPPTPTVGPPLWGYDDSWECATTSIRLRMRSYYLADAPRPRRRGGCPTSSAAVNSRNDADFSAHRILQFLQKCATVFENFSTEASPHETPATAATCRLWPQPRRPLFQCGGFRFRGSPG